MRGLGKINEEIIKSLSEIVGSENITTDEIEIECYSRDASENVGKPGVIVWPRSTVQVSKIMKLAYENVIPVVPRGAGSSLSGGPIPVRDGILMVMTRMNKTIEFDPENFQIMVESGCVLNDINNFLSKKGFFFPIDPLSADICTVGGAIAVNAGGARGLKYGTMKDWIQGLELVLSDGRVTWTGARTRKCVSGYDLPRLIAGSEGTLAVITKALLRVAPLPETRRMILSFFKRVKDAGNAAYNIITSGIEISMAEFLDRNTMNAVSNYTGMKFPEDAVAMLIVEVEGDHGEVEKRLKRLEEIFKSAKGFKVRISRSESENADIYYARKSAFPSLSSIKPTAIIEDVTVPISRIPELLVKLDEIATKYNVTIGTFGHIGDGNTHPTLIFDERDQDESKRVKAAIKEIFETAIQLGGTLTGEHGIGLSKAEFMMLEHSEAEMWMMREIKRALDPKNILNPYKMSLVMK